MGELVSRLVGLFGFGLAAGGALCVFFIERQLTDDGRFYTLYKQLLIRALTVPLPALGVLGMVAAATQATLLWRRHAMLALALVVGAIVLNAASIALTKAGLFPLNDQILTWDARQPPATWPDVQAKWQTLHVARTVMSVSSFALLLASALVGHDRR